MPVLSFEKPKKLRSTEEHNDIFQSDTNIAGTYVPNMSEEDKLKWKAKKISGDDPRVEIRKTVYGKAPDIAVSGYAQVLIVVRKSSVVISSNGRMVFDATNWDDLKDAVDEARNIL